MSKHELPEQIKPTETPEEKDRRITIEARKMFEEESRRGLRDKESAKKPGLDDYDNRREPGTQYQGRYGKYDKE